MATSIYLKLGNLKGESTKDVKHKDWIDVLSFSWGVSNPSTISPNGGPVAGEATLSNFNLMKTMDSLTPVLAFQCASGAAFDTAQVDLVKPTTKDPLTFFTFKFTNVLITSLQEAGSSEIPAENIGFSYETVQWTYNKLLDTGVVTPVTKGWSVSTNSGA